MILMVIVDGWNGLLLVMGVVGLVEWIDLYWDVIVCVM